MQLDSGVHQQPNILSRRILTVFASALLVLVGIVAFTGDFSAPVDDNASISTAATQLSSARTCSFDLTNGYTSTMFPDYTGFKTVRADTGVINGPLPVEPNPPKDQIDFGNGFTKSFNTISPTWVRFQDLGEYEGGTSLSQIFQAWPLSASALKSANIKTLTNAAKNFNFTSVDIQLAAALKAGSKIDWRIGDSHQVMSLIAAGTPVDLNGGGSTVTFPKKWAFCTDLTTSQGMKLYTAVALKIAEHVWEFVGKDSSKIVFDLITETNYGSVFWPYTPELYTTLYSNVMGGIKSKISSDVQCIGGNTISPLKKPEAGQTLNWFQLFLQSCGNMGYKKCPLDIVAFHVFGPTLIQSIPSTTLWAQEQAQTYLKSFKTQPTFAMTAWGFHGSGAYSENSAPAGAAAMANSLIAIENSPIEFTTYYKWTGIRCILNIPCLVTYPDGGLKPPGLAFAFHAAVTKTQGSSGKRISAACDGAATIAASNYGKTKMTAMLAPTFSGTKPNVDDYATTTHSLGAHNIKVQGMKCAGKSVTLTIQSAATSVTSTGAAKTTTITTTGKISNGQFFEAGASQAYQVSGFGYGASLTLACK
jgi:hypothetical protein